MFTLKEFIKVNAELLPVVPGSPQGGIYRVIDAGAEPGRMYTYLLLECEISGARAKISLNTIVSLRYQLNEARDAVVQHTARHRKRNATPQFSR